MKYKVGDEVLVKAKVTEIEESDPDLPIFIRIGEHESAWCSESEIQNKEQKDQKQFPREMWVWNDIIEQKQKAEVVYIADRDLNTFPVCAIMANGKLFAYMNCAEIDSITLSLDEAKQIIAEAKGVDVSEVNIEVK